MVVPTLDSKINDRIPFVTYFLIAVNGIVFIAYALFAPFPSGWEALFQGYGLIPKSPTLHGFFTCMFLHADAAHVATNMFFLWFFGANAERKLGSMVFALMYLAAGLAGGVAFILINPNFEQPLVGASGAVSGVLGAYLVLFAKREIEMFYFIFVTGGTFRIAAWMFACMYFLINLLSGLLGSQFSPVAYWAHLGGVVAGIAVCLPLHFLHFKFGEEIYPPFPEDTPTEGEVKSGTAKITAQSAAEYYIISKAYVAGQKSLDGPLSLIEARARKVKQKDAVQILHSSLLNELPPLEFASSVEFKIGKVCVRGLSGKDYKVTPDSCAAVSAAVVRGISFVDVVLAEPYCTLRINNEVESSAIKLVQMLPGAPFSDAFSEFTRGGSSAFFKSHSEYDDYVRWLVNRLDISSAEDTEQPDSQKK